MNAPASVTKDQLRARDGDKCWLCTLQMNFSAVPNSKNAATIEHLEPKSRGGTGELKNLALCHQRCNAHLKDRPLAQKLEMQAKWHANAAKGAVTQANEDAKPSSNAKKKHATPQAGATRSEPMLSSSRTQAARGELVSKVAYWRRWALISIGAALVSLGFALGLCVALLAR